MNLLKAILRTDLSDLFKSASLGHWPGGAGDGGRSLACGRTALLLAWAVFSAVPVRQASGAAGELVKVTIVANAGPFASIEEAARSEEKVEFWDDKPVDDVACTESFAAVELRQFMARCLGVAAGEIGLADPKRLPEGGDVIVLGSRVSNPLIASLRANVTSAPAELSAAPSSFRIRALPRDGGTMIVIEGADRTGTLYGVYAFLEQLGMRFLGLGEHGTVYPSGRVRLPDKLDLRESPGFATRGFWTSAAKGNEPLALWMARNRMNIWTAGELSPHVLAKLGIKVIAGGHGFQEKFLDPGGEYPYDHSRHKGDERKPKDPYAVGTEYLGDADRDGRLSYAEAHPEWYALRGGKREAHRQKGLRYNYCTSNRDATHELAINLVRSLIEGDYSHADVVDLMMLDHAPWCECRACQEQGTCTDRMLVVEHGVCREIQAARRQGRLGRSVQLRTPAYLETLAPPTKPLPADFDYSVCSVTFFPISRCYAHPLADPACSEINARTFDCFQGWTARTDRFYRGSVGLGEYYNVSSIKSLPVVYTRLMSADIPWFYRQGVRDLHYMHVLNGLWGTWTLNQRLLSRLLWNPEADATAILDDYFRLYYPTTGQRTRAFYEHLERATANIKAFKHHVWIGGSTYHCLMGKLNSRDADLFPMEHLRYDVFHAPVNDAPDVVEIIESMNKARAEIDAALLACTDANERLRLLEDDRRFSYGEAMFLFIYHLVRTEILDRQGDTAAARREFAALDGQAGRLREMVDVVQVAFRHASAKNGLEATQAESTYEYYRKKYGAQETRP